jgi:hypothetical protein
MEMRCFAKSPCRRRFFFLIDTGSGGSQWQFFLGFYLLIAFSSASRRWEFINTTKNVLQKNRVENILQRNRQKIENRFFLDFFITFFGRFSVR